MPPEPAPQPPEQMKKPAQQPEQRAAEGQKIPGGPQPKPQALIEPEPAGIERQRQQAEEKYQGEQKVCGHRHGPEAPPDGPAQVIKKPQQEPRAPGPQKVQGLMGKSLCHRKSL